MLLLRTGLPLWIPLVITVVGGMGCSVPRGLDMKLMKALTSDLSENQAISPFVMSTLMTQVWLGARGTTRDEMTPILGLCGPNHSTFLPAYKAAIAALSKGSTGVTTAIFNRIYVRSSFTIKPTFSSFLKNYYGADVEKFSSATQASSKINGDVAKVTQNRIKQLVSPALLRGSQMVLVSALYFKGTWKYRFNRTKTESFLTAAGDVPVNMMVMNSAPKLLYVNMSSFDAVSLPYTDEQFSLLVLRPLARTMAAVRSLQSSLHNVDPDAIYRQMRKRAVDISMPRFKIEKDYKLKKTMSGIGIRRIFTPAADLSGIGGKGLHVGEIVHKVFLEVTEEGTEAAGAGAVVIYGSPRPVIFTLDRPFFVILCHRNHKIALFSAFVALPRD